MIYSRLEYALGVFKAVNITLFQLLVKITKKMDSHNLFYKIKSDKNKIARTTAGRF